MTYASLWRNLSLLTPRLRCQVLLLNTRSVEGGILVETSRSRRLCVGFFSNGKADVDKICTQLVILKAFLEEVCQAIWLEFQSDKKMLYENDEFNLSFFNKKYVSTFFDGICSCGWKESWDGLLVVTGVSTSWAEVIMLKHQSALTVLLRTPFTRTIKFHFCHLQLNMREWKEIGQRFPVCKRYFQCR